MREHTAKKKAFTLVEILIIVSILGILTALVFPEYKSHIIQTKEATAKEMLQMLRTQIEVYTTEHYSVPPGYPNGDTSAVPNGQLVIDQLTLATNKIGQTAKPGTPGFDYGPYISKMPKNPFNSGVDVHILPDDSEGINPEPAKGTGWLYHGPTKSITIYNNGTDSAGISFKEY